MPTNLVKTEVYDTYWRFAAERQAIYFRRMENSKGPWSDDAILNKYRFTNTYRVTDRVSQYLVKNIQYNTDLEQTREEIFFRTMLFKIFNKIETWELLNFELGPIGWRETGLHNIQRVLGELFNEGVTIYSAAYIMASPNFGFHYKYLNHLSLLGKMMRDGLPEKLASMESLRSVYEALLSYPGLGSFLAFQYTIDLNYSTLINHDESDYVMAGPGALDGISKCFDGLRGRSPNSIIKAMAERQEYEFDRLNLTFKDLYGRRLQLIDCQNIFCEISKYSRVAHPEIQGKSGRTKIKQKYEQKVFGFDSASIPAT